MARPTKDINVERCERLKTLLSEVKQRDSTKTQTQVANEIPISQQVLSNIVNAKANLTETTAKRIIELFPEYRFEWLWSGEGFKTFPEEADYYMERQLNEWRKEDSELQNKLYLMSFVCGFGYEIEVHADLKLIKSETGETVTLSKSEATQYYEELSSMIKNFVQFHFERHKKAGV